MRAWKHKTMHISELEAAWDWDFTSETEMTIDALAELMEDPEAPVPDDILDGGVPEFAGPGVLLSDSHEVTGPPICDEDHLFMDDSSGND